MRATETPRKQIGVAPDGSTYWQDADGNVYRMTARKYAKDGSGLVVSGGQWCEPAVCKVERWSAFRIGRGLRSSVNLQRAS